MITRSNINTKFSYFMMYTRIGEDVIVKESGLIKSSESSIVDLVIEEFSNKHKLIDHPFLWALSAMKSDVNLVLDKETEDIDYFSENFIETLTPISIFKNVRIED